MNKTDQRTNLKFNINNLEIIILIISIFTHILFLSHLNLLREYPTRFVSSVQIRLTRNAVPPGKQVHLSSIIQLPEKSGEDQQIVDLEDFIKLEFDMIEISTESVVLAEDEVALDLEKLIQQPESEFSLLPMLSAPLPKDDPNSAPVLTALNSTLSGVADQEKLNVEKTNTPSFLKKKMHDEEFPEQIPKQERGIQLEIQRSENPSILRKKANLNLPEGYFLNKSITDREASELNRKLGNLTKRIWEVPANSFSNGQEGLLGFEGNSFFKLSNYQWSYESYMGRWAKHLHYAWNSQPPEDYIQGSQPNGGDVVIQVQLNRQGDLESFEMISSFGSSIQMKESVVNAILSVSQLPPLPDTFQDENLIVRFKFIYPAY